MKRYVLAFCVLVVFGGLATLIYRAQSHRASVLAAGQISAILNSSALIAEASKNGTRLTAEDLQRIPGLLDVISLDFGSMPDAGDFFRLSDAFVSSFGLKLLPGGKIGHDAFIMHAPSGFVYYAGYPVSMSESSGQNVTQVIQPGDGDAGRVNPYKGWAPWAKNLPIEAIDYTLAYANLSWRDLEPAKGQYDFSLIEKENQFVYCREHNIRLILRLILDYPGRLDESQLPQWLFNEIKGDGTWYANDLEHRGFSPNYANPVLIEAHQRLLAALGKQYDQDPLIAFIQLGSLGHYGEWHVSTNAGQMPSPEITAAYVSHYQAAFPSKVFMFRRPVTQMSLLTAGLYNDMIGDKSQTERWLNWIATGGDREFPDMVAVPDFWHQGPSGGEFGFGDPYRFLDDKAYPETLRQIAASHTSVIGPNTPTQFASTEQRDNALDLLDHLGYRFRIRSASFARSAKPGSNVALQIQGANLGNSPMYYAWPVQVQLLNSQGESMGQWRVKTDIRKWLPGEFVVSETLPLPENLSPGLYTWTFAILDPATGKSGIHLANKTIDEDGSIALGQIVISKQE